MKCSLTIIGCFVLFNSMISCSYNNKAAKVECEYPEVDGNHPEAEVEYPAAEEAIVEAPAPCESLEEICANIPKESFEERFESMNPWRKGYFKNEWGEDNPNLPYIYTTITGSAWDIHVGYESAKSTQTASGVFGIYIMDEHGHTSMYAPVNILIRGADGETKNVPVTDVTDGVAYITNPGAVAVLMDYLNTDQFDILLEFDKYNERHATQARWEASPGSYGEAINKLL